MANQRFKKGDYIYLKFAGCHHHVTVIEPKDGLYLCHWVEEENPKNKSESYGGLYDLENPNKYKIIKVNPSKKPMNLVQSFTNLFLSEPEKTFREAGVTGEDGMLTSTGEKVFMAWLLKKYGNDFKTEVVDKIIAEQEAKNK